MQVKQADAVRTFLHLEPWEDAVFWSVYEEYRADAAKMHDGLVRLIRDYAGNSDHLSDPQAEQHLNEFLRLKQEAINFTINTSGDSDTFAGQKGREIVSARTETECRD